MAEHIATAASFDRPHTTRRGSVARDKTQADEPCRITSRDTTATRNLAPAAAPTAAAAYTTSRVRAAHPSILAQAKHGPLREKWMRRPSDGVQSCPAIRQNVKTGNPSWNRSVDGER